MMCHVCLIPFCIIDMNLAVFFKQLNNLLPCMLTQLVPGEDKNHNHTLFFFSWKGWLCFNLEEACFFFFFLSWTNSVLMELVHWKQAK